MPLRNLLIVLAVLILGGTIYYFSAADTTEIAENELLISVEQGEFVINVIATGELKAKNSEKIRGPVGMRSAGIWQTNISDMVPEGTVVKPGEYVAELDKTEVSDKIREAQTEIEKIQTQLDQARIDTAIELRGIRDDLINLKFGMQEKKLQVEQSKYEAPMVIQQAELELQRSERDYTQLVSKLGLSREKAVAKISEINTSLKQNQRKLKTLSDLAGEFRVTAPKEGMVIYARSWNGKVGPGSTVRAWDPVVAELPDLTDMISKSYVNEVDISRVKKGQDVTIKIDAFPDNTYAGTVIQVANIGEELRNYDTKVFEVLVQLHQVDSIMRPAMTTSNEIVTDIYDTVKYIPLEAVFSDSLTYVFKKEDKKTVKQEIITGPANNDKIIVAHGLMENEQVLLLVPENAKELPFYQLDKNVKEKVLRDLQEDATNRNKRMTEKMNAVKDENIKSSNGDSDVIIMF